MESGLVGHALAVRPGDYIQKENRMDYLKAFLIGGLLCLPGQLLIDKTSLTPARILTGYVVAGVLLGALGLYEPLVDFAGAGASVPLFWLWKYPGQGRSAGCGCRWISRYLHRRALRHRRGHHCRRSLRTAGQPLF